MAKPIFTITREHVEQMLENSYKKIIRNNLGDCRYAAPCIIGSVMPADIGEELDNVEDGGSNIVALVYSGHVALEGVDIEGLSSAQIAFDTSYKATSTLRSTLYTMRKHLKESIREKETSKA